MFFVRLQKNSTGASLAGRAVWPPVWSIATASIVAYTVTVFDANAWVNVRVRSVDKSAVGVKVVRHGDGKVGVAFTSSLGALTGGCAGISIRSRCPF